MHSREPLEQVDSAMRGRNLKGGRSRKQSEQAKLVKSPTHPLPLIPGGITCDLCWA